LAKNGSQQEQERKRKISQIDENSTIVGKASDEHGEANLMHLGTIDRGL